MATFEQMNLECGGTAEELDAYETEVEFGGIPVGFRDNCGNCGVPIYRGQNGYCGPLCRQLDS